MDTKRLPILHTDKQPRSMDARDPDSPALSAFEQALLNAARRIPTRSAVDRKAA